MESHHPVMPRFTNHDSSFIFGNTTKNIFFSDVEARLRRAFSRIPGCVKTSGMPKISIYGDYEQTSMVLKRLMKEWGNPSDKQTTSFCLHVISDINHCDIDACANELNLRGTGNDIVVCCGKISEINASDNRVEAFCHKLAGFMPRYRYKQQPRGWEPGCDICVMVSITPFRDVS